MTLRKGSAGTSDARPSLLVDRSFALLWSARTLSLMGDYAFRVALVTYTISITHSPTALAAVIAVLLIPSLVFYLIGGVIGDRTGSRRTVMVWANVLQFGAAAAIAAVAGLTHALVLVAALALFIGVGDGFFRPASFAYLTEIVPPQRLVAANSANSLSQQFALIVGPLLGGLLIGFGGPSVAFAFNAGTFLASAVLILLIRHRPPAPVPGTAPSPAPATRGPRGVLRDVAAGLAYVRGQRWLLITCLVGAVANAVFTGSLDVSVPLILAPQGVEQATSLGSFYALEGVGALAGAAVLSRLTIIRVGPLLYVMTAVMATSLVLVGLTGGGPGAYAAALSYGVGLHFFNSLYPALLQRKVDRSMLSRVSSLVFFGFNGLMPLGVILMGPLVTAIDAEGAAILTGAVVAVGCLAVALLPTIRLLTFDSEQFDSEQEGSDERAT